MLTKVIAKILNKNVKNSFYRKKMNIYYQNHFIIRYNLST